MKPHALSSTQLDAFEAVAEHRHFTRAARALGITQSALSQRVLNLEREVGSALFVRARGRVDVTPAGARLLVYKRIHRELEADAMADIAGERYARSVRVASYSSVARALVVPALGEVVRAEPSLEAQSLVREMRDLPALLFEGRADYVVVDRVIAGPHVRSVALGEEVNVLIESTRPDARRDVYLDHDENDPTTELFLHRQRKRPATIRRAFVDDIDAIIAAVVEGWGRGVVPEHLLRSVKGTRIVDGLSALRTPVVLHFLERTYATRLHDTVVSAFQRAANDAFARRTRR